MPEQENQDGVLNMKVGDSIISVLYKNPEPSELINTLVQKMPRGDEDEDAGRTLLANLELGRSCITGIAGGQEWGKAFEDESGWEWKERICRENPLVLIALGQYLSRIPEFMEGDASKKS